jgi:hypothetical protein
MVSSMPSLAGTSIIVTSALFEGGSLKCAGFQTRRDPAGTVATDFKGNGAPCVNGRIESWKVPRVAVPAQPGGGAGGATVGVVDGSEAKAIAAANASEVKKGIALETDRAGKKSIWGDSTLSDLPSTARRRYPVPTGVWRGGPDLLSITATQADVAQTLLSAAPRLRTPGFAEFGLNQFVAAGELKHAPHLSVLLSLHIFCTPRRLAEQTTENKRMLTALIQKLNADCCELARSALWDML